MQPRAAHFRFPYRWLLLLPLLCLVVLNLIIEHLRMQVVPIPEWVRDVDEYLPLTGVLIACLIAGIAKIASFGRAGRLFVWSCCFYAALWVAVPLLQSPRPQPAYLRILREGQHLVFDMWNYAEKHEGHFPPHQSALLLTGTYPSHLTDPDLVPLELPSPSPPASEWQTLAADADEHSIFIYTAADLLDPSLLKGKFGGSLDPSIIVAYTKPRRVVPSHRILVFANSHSAIVPDAAAATYFAVSNSARARLGLPPFSLDGPPPVLPAP